MILGKNQTLILTVKTTCYNFGEESDTDSYRKDQFHEFGEESILHFFPIQSIYIEMERIEVNNLDGYRFETGTPAIPQCDFGISVTMTLILSFGALRVSETVLVIL
jgi:hypothetical protein